MGIEGKIAVLGTWGALAAAFVANPAHAALDGAMGGGLDGTDPGPWQGDATRSDPRDIVVFGWRDDGSFSDIAAEDELGERDIASYGRGTVGELLDDIGADLGQGEPVVLVNGKPVNGLGDVASLPTEAVARIQLLPSHVAVQFGQTPTRRVINVVVKPAFRQVTLTGDTAFAWAGGAARASAEAGYTRIRNGNRTTVSLRGRYEASLDEAARGIDTTLDAGIPYDLAGNVVGSPHGSEIDPALSAAAGAFVTVAGVPVGAANPGLTDFARLAGTANRTPLGSYRTLLPRVRQITGNVALHRNLSARTSLSASLRADLAEGLSRTGASAALFTVPASSPFSPFATDVLLARYFGPALEQLRRAGTVNAAATYNTTRGLWRFTATTNYAWRRTTTRSERGLDLTSLSDAIAAGSVNPFASGLSVAGAAMRSDRTINHAETASVQLQASGPFFRLPAGAARASIRLGASIDRNDGNALIGGIMRDTAYGRDEINGLAGLDLPLIAAGRGGLGSLQLNLSAGFRRSGAIGTLPSWSAGTVWRNAGDNVTVNALYSEEDLPPSAQLLSDSVVVTSGARVFDFLRGETVSVDLVTGGNPTLAPERRRTLRVGADVKPVGGIDLHLEADYLRQRSSNVTAALPPVSAAVQAAFPDRYLRNADGELTTVDARSVTFARDAREQLRWGLRLRHQMGRVSAGDGAAASGSLRASASAWRIDAGLHHTWLLSSTRLARPGLPVIDMLDGGAEGYGGGSARHRIDMTVRITGRGFGVDGDVNWKSGSVIRAGSVASPADLVFDPLAQVDLRLWADAGTLMPEQGWAKSLRLSIDVDNLTGAQQRVHDGAGQTPLRYQPWLLDPVGRSIKASLRKAF